MRDTPALVMQAAACAFHAEREALGVCVACRSRVCAECTTKVEGINYCVRCLAGLAAAENADPSQSPGTADGAGTIVATLLTSVVFFLMVWSLLELAFPEGA